MAKKKKIYPDDDGHTICNMNVEGMLPFEQAGENLTRRYRREESLARIAHIRQLRQEGKSVPEIKALLGREL